MEIILLERIRNLGDLGDQVRVKAGYARNYLIPHGKAVPATAENKATFDARRAELEAAAAESLTGAQARAQKLEGLTLQITRKVGEEGKLFGSVSAGDIIEAAAAAGFELTKSEIDLPDGPLKTVGDFEIHVGLHPQVETKIIVSVVGES